MQSIEGDDGSTYKLICTGDIVAYASTPKRCLAMFGACCAIPARNQTPMTDYGQRLIVSWYNTIQATEANHCYYCYDGSMYFVKKKNYFKNKLQQLQNRKIFDWLRSNKLTL